MYSMQYSTDVMQYHSLRTLHAYADIQHTLQNLCAHGLLQLQRITPVGRESVVHLVKHFGLVPIGSDEPGTFAVPSTHGIRQQALHRIAHFLASRPFQVDEQVQVAERIITRMPHVDEHVVLRNGIGNVKGEFRLIAPVPRSIGDGQILLKNNTLSTPEQEC